MSDSIRLDKWLWAARFFKTRSLASEAIALGRISVNGAPAKASREVRVGDRIGVRRTGLTQDVDVRGVSAQRGPASTAQALYLETPESVAERERQAQLRRMAPEPAAAMDQGRPTKRNRRDLADWQRWSASADD